MGPPSSQSTNRKKSHEVDRVSTINHQGPSTPGENPPRNPSKPQKNWLVVEPYPSEKYDFVSWGYSSQYIYIWKESHNPFMFQTTNHQHPSTIQPNEIPMLLHTFPQKPSHIREEMSPRGHNFWCPPVRNTFPAVPMS